MRHRDLQACAERLPEGSVEREYHGAILRVLDGVEFPRSEDVALALLEILQTTDFQIGEVDSLRHPAAGSLLEDADLIACVFREVADDPGWWVVDYQHLSLEGRVRIAPLVDFWAETFEQSENVSRFER